MQTVKGSTSIVLMGRAEQMLAEATTVQKAKELKDLALTAKDWAKRKGLGEAVVQKATLYSRLAKDRLGQLLIETKEKRAKGRGRAVKGKKHFQQRLPAGIAVEDEPTLAQLGVTPKESKESQDFAKLPESLKKKVLNGEITETQAKRQVKEREREKKREADAKVVAGAKSKDIVSLGRFATIVIDPPWDWKDEDDVDQMGRAKPTYETMSLEKLLALPVGKLAADDCHIYLWITNRSLPKGFQLLEAWGFRYISCLTWCKPSIGMGNYFRGSTEHVLFGVKGSLPLNRKDVGTWFAAARQGPHSAKPDELYALVRSCSPEPRADIFARGPREGFLPLGAEHGDFRF